MSYARPASGIERVREKTNNEKNCVSAQKIAKIMEIQCVYQARTICQHVKIPASTAWDLDIKG